MQERRASPMKEDAPQTWRVWVDAERRIVSFHQEPGFQLMEFHSHELFLKYMDTFIGKDYRYQ